MLSHHSIPVSNLPLLEGEVGELNKRASRLSLPALSLDVGDPWVKIVPRWSESRQEWIAREVPHVWISIEGETIVLDGWTFVATLHHAGEGETIIAAVPGETVPVAYRWANATCDHCSTLRRRNATYLVRHEDGTIKQVGRSCLRDFLPMADRNPENVARWAELLGGLVSRIGTLGEEDLMGRDGRREPAWTLKEVLITTSLIIRKEGWLSSTVARERGGAATKDSVLAYLYGDTKTDEDTKRWIKKIGAPEEEDEQRAAATLEWAEETLVPERDGSLSDYEHNLGVVARLGIVKQRSLGIACSMIRAWQRAKGVEDEKKGKETIVSEWLPEEIGARVHLSGVKVTRAMEMEDRGYGASCLIKMDWEGKTLTWFASSSAFWPKEGETLEIKATIKDKKEYKGARETVVTRVKTLVAASDTMTMIRYEEK